MALRLNPEAKLQVDNLTDYGGNIVDTFGVDLYGVNGIEGRRGEIGFGTKMFPHSVNTDSGLSSIALTTSFLYTDADGTARYWANDVNKCYKVSDPLSSHFAADGLSNTPTSTKGAMSVFGRASSRDNLIVPTSTDLWKLNSSWTANWWTSTLGQPALSSNDHDLLFFPSPFLLLIPDGNQLHSIDQANVVTYGRVQFSANHVIAWSRYANGLAYFGVTTTDKSSGGVWEYDPTSESAVFIPYDIPGGAAGSPFILHNRLYVLAPDARLKEFDGTGFTNWKETPASKRNQPVTVHRNGITVLGTRIRIAVNGLAGYWKAGVWTVDLLDGNLYHELPVVCGVSDAGQDSMADVGALWNDGTRTFGSFTANSSPQTSGIFMDSNRFSSTVVSRNFVVFPKMLTENVRENWVKAVVKHALFGSDTYLVKYRNREYSGGQPPGSTALVTWTSTTVFTTTGLTDYLNMTGYEVTILQGTNAGQTAHISSISVSGGTYTVTLDEAIGLGSGTSTLIFLPWKKLVPRIALSTASQFSETALPNEPAEWEQLKIEMRGTTSFIKDVFLEHTPNVTVK